MDILERSKHQIKGTGKRVALPESADERIIAAARRLIEENLAIPVLSAEGERIEGAEYIDPATDLRRASYAETL
ncbi:MAG: phosphate acyltransferase, partial [Pseudomonadota bacterium]